MSLIISNTTSREKPLNYRKNTLLFPFRCSAEAFSMSMSTLNHSSDHRVAHHQQLKLFIHQLGSSSLPGAVWRSPCDRSPSTPAMSMGEQGLWALPKQGQLLHQRLVSPGSGDRVTSRCFHVSYKFIHTPKLRLVSKSPVFFRWKRNRAAALADKTFPGTSHQPHLKRKATKLREVNFSQT